MALTCNYFGANNYSKKLTIKDLKRKVVAERSKSKELVAPPLRLG